MYINKKIFQFTLIVCTILISTTSCNQNLNEKYQSQSTSSVENETERITQNEPKENDLTQCLEPGDYLAQDILDSRSESKLLKLPFNPSRYEQISLNSQKNVIYLGKIKELPNYCSQVTPNNNGSETSSNDKIISEISDTLNIELFNRLFTYFKVDSSSPNNKFKIFVTVVNNPSSQVSELDNERLKLASNERHQNFSFTQVVAINKCIPNTKCYNLILKDVDLTNSNPHNNVFVALSAGMFKILAHIELEQRNISLDNGEGILSAGSKVFSNFTGANVESIDETLKLNNPENFSPAIVGAFFLKEFGSKPEGFKGLTPVQKQKLFEVDMGYLVDNAGFWASGLVSKINKDFQLYMADYSESGLKDFNSFYDLTQVNKNYLVLDKVKAFQVAAEILNRQFKSISDADKPGEQFTFLWNVRENRTLDAQNQLNITTEVSMNLAGRIDAKQMEEQAKSKNINGYSSGQK
ncbi:MAG: hypothetical protein RMY29_006325 [Nostoc sp. CreGUA01]|nr:hypothetical protein [Nostoc sp. CreGUA01]